MDTVNKTTNALFAQYIDVVNRAIAANKDRIPFKQLLAIGEKIIGDKKVGAAVYKTDPDTPHEWFTLSFKNEKFHATHGKHAPDIAWKVNEEHLRNVVADPATFIEHPMKLDLDWLETRLRNG